MRFLAFYPISMGRPYAIQVGDPMNQEHKGHKSTQVKQLVLATRKKRGTKLAGLHLLCSLVVCWDTAS